MDSCKTKVEGDSGENWREVFVGSACSCQTGAYLGDGLNGAIVGVFGANGNANSVSGNGRCRLGEARLGKTGDESGRIACTRGAACCHARVYNA